MRYWFRFIIVVWGLVLVNGTGLAQANGVPPVEISIMSFNIWVGGELVNFDKVVEAIQASEADIVGLQEAGGNTRRIADLLGWPYASERMQIISRFPLIDPPGAEGMYIYAQIELGRVVAVSNIHLPSDPYGPYLVRDGESLEAVLENEAATRMEALRPFVAVFQAVVESGMPLLVSGDFNSPSHLDWVAGMENVTPHIKFPVEWPVTRAMEAAGLVDTYRAAHPDPTARVGMTWTPGYPVPRLRPSEVSDRIDLVFAGGPIEVLASQIVGEANGADVDIPVNPWPSDHRGVVSTVLVSPVEPALFVAVEQRRVEAGQPLIVRYHAPEGEEVDRIVIVAADGNAPDDALMSLPPYEADFHGSVTFGTATLEPGDYAAVLVNSSGDEVSRSSFWVVEPGAVSVVTTAAPSYHTGEAITITWENAPAQRWDWLAVYASGESDLYNYLAYIYTRADVAGSTVLDAAVLGEAMLPPGEYEVRLMLDDVYIVMASALFTVTE
jgi:endonuclease/exonuclease/phosphatase family metal-dependent hydrolase